MVASYGFIVTPCQRERARRLHLPLMEGKYVPRCRVDGTYDEVQCDVVIGQCWCVDRDGREFRGTRSAGVIRCPGEGTCKRITTILYIFHFKCLALGFNDKDVLNAHGIF